MQPSQLTSAYILEKVDEAKQEFERALNCKRTEFDDLYPYMIEHPQFFWYKRYVAWAELLGLIKICTEIEISWESSFTVQQVSYVKDRVLSARVLDGWFEIHDSKEHIEELGENR